MKHKLLPALIFSCVIVGCRADQPLNRGTESSARVPQIRDDFVVMPGSTNAVQLRLYTNASPDAPHLFNTFDIEAYGQKLLESPGGKGLREWLIASPSNASVHNILIDGSGPRLDLTNGMTVLEQASGPDWRYIALDVSPAYRDRLEQFRRGILFVEPDLFVLYDHIVAKEPVNFRMLLHPPAATRLDAIWNDLRLDSPKGGLRINAPAGRHMLRSWEQIESAADSILPGTVTMQLGPTNKLTKLDLLTVFAVCGGGEKREYAFKLLESNSAIGARIHRGGLPTLVAFRTDPATGQASLTGFEFNGPVGVSVFKPKKAH